MQKKQQNLKKIGVFVLLLILGGVAGYFLGKVGAKSAVVLPKMALLAIILYLIPCIFLVIAVHELGHAFAGILVNFNFKMYVVGPFMWEKEPTGWRFKWNKNVNIAGGMVLCLPRGTHQLTKRFAWFAAGGPLASLLLTLLGYAAYWMFKNAGFLLPAYIFFITAAFSLLIFIVTIMPLHAGGFSSDGARIIRLLRGGDIAKFELLVLQLITNSSEGLRPKLFNKDTLFEAQSLATQLNAPFGVYIHGFLHQTTLDEGDIDAAEQHLQNYINNASAIPDGVRNAVWLDAAFFYAYAKNDLTKALEYWHIFTPAAMISKAQILATEAAILHLQNEPAQALIKIEESLQQIPAMIDKGVGVALKDKLENLKLSLGLI